MSGAVSRGYLGAHTHICQHTNVHIRVGARRHGLGISCRISGADERESGAGDRPVSALQQCRSRTTYARGTSGSVHERERRGV